jgi:cytochrome P450
MTDTEPALVAPVAFAELTRAMSRVEDGINPDPYETLSWLREQAPVYQVPGPDGIGHLWLVTDFDLARRCLADPRLSFDPANGSTPHTAPEHDPYILARDAPEHTRLRKLVSDEFSPRSVARYTDRIRQLCTELAEALPAGPVDLVTEYALPIPELVMYEFFGIPEHLRLPLGLGTELSIRIAFAEQAQHGPAMTRMHDYMQEVIEYKRVHPGPDLTSALIAKADSAEVRDPTELADMLYLLYATGQLSTAPMVACALARLLTPGAAEIGELQWRRAVEEALRLDAPVQTTMPRFALTDFDLHDVSIAKGDTVMVSVAAANRDPAVFPDPDTFRLDRQHRVHLGFGQGPHFCIGAPLARLEGEIALEALFRAHPGIRLDTAPESLVWTLGPMLRIPRTIPAIIPGEV